MAFAIVTLRVPGLPDIRPQTFEFAMALGQAAREFSAKVKLQGMSQAELVAALAGSPKVEIFAASSDGIAYGDRDLGDLIFTGHVEKRAPAIRAEENELVISGRSKTGDLVDSAADHDSGEWRDQTAPQVLGALSSKYAIEIETDLPHKPRSLFRIRPGETVFEAADRWARAEGFTLTDTAKGKLKLYKATAPKRHAESIREGLTRWPKLLDGSAVLDDSKKFSHVKVRAQAPSGYGPDDLQIEDEARDETINRRRLRVVTPPELVARDDARARAAWHRDRASGEGTSAELSLAGWRDNASNLWTPGWLVHVESPSLGLVQDMLIKSVRLSQADADAGSTRARLSLVDPRSFGGKKGKGSKSGKQWDVGKAGGDDA